MTNAHPKTASTERMERTHPGQYQNFNVWFGAFFLLLLLVPAWLAAQTKVSMIDDVWCAVSAGAYGHGSTASFVRHVFLDSDLSRYRWFWELEQNLRWSLLGDHPGLHHLVMLAYRVLTALGATLVVRELTNSWLGFAPAATIAYGLFLPVVPEARLGLQEPLFSLSMIFSLLCVCRLLQRYGGDIRRMPMPERLALIFSFVCLSGTKETAVAPLFLFVVVVLASQFFNRQLASPLSLGLTLLVAFTIWRVLLVANGDAYSVEQANVDRFNIGWFVWRLRQTIWILLAGPSGLPWLSGIITIIYFAGAVTAVRTMWAGTRSGRMQSIIVIGALLVGMLLVTAKLKFVMRYAEPLIWIASLMFGLGVWGLERQLKNSWQKWCLGILVLLVPLGNYSAFVWQFATQANYRDMENSTIVSIEEAYAQNPEIPLFVFGASPNHSWDGVRRFEHATLMKSYLHRYRPIFRGVPSIDLRPVEQQTDSEAKNDWTLVAMSSLQDVEEALGQKLVAVPIVTHTLGADRVTTDLMHNMQWICQACCLSAGHEDAWADSGSPHAFQDLEKYWTIWSVKPSNKSQVE
jgi:hypothetical protein